MSNDEKVKDWWNSDQTCQCGGKVIRGTCFGFPAFFIIKCDSCDLRIIDKPMGSAVHEWHQLARKEAYNREQTKPSVGGNVHKFTDANGCEVKGIAGAFY